MANGTYWGTLGQGVSGSPRNRLARLVSDLERERLRQILLDHAGAGLFAGLVLACALVLAVRTGHLDVPAGTGTLWLLILCLAGAAAIGWWRRPDPLEVAIQADLALDLDQQLSTAWEFAGRKSDPALADRLAAQAIGIRMAFRRKVFPLRLGTSARLVPVAAAALVLASLIDLPTVDGPVATALDPAVAEEGARLQAHALRMESDARREGLPRAAAQAREMHRAGARMQSSALTRGRALERLRALSSSLDQQRRAALAEGVRNDIDPSLLNALATRPAAAERRSDDLLSKMSRGGLNADDVESLRADARGLSAAGITPEQLERALEAFEQGDSEALRQILEQLSQMDESVREALELLEAEQVVERARDNLGDGGLREGDRERTGIAETEEDGGEAGDDGMGMLSERPVHGDPENARHGTRGGRGLGDNWSEELRTPAARSGIEVTGPMLRPQSRPGAGRTEITEARILPRPGEVTVPATTLDPRYQAQVEAVLSRDEFPPHQKDLVRRYFLSISAGVDGAGKESDTR